MHVLGRRQGLFVVWKKGAMGRRTHNVSGVMFARARDHAISFHLLATGLSAFMRACHANRRIYPDARGRAAISTRRRARAGNAGRWATR